MRYLTCSISENEPGSSTIGGGIGLLTHNINASVSCNGENKIVLSNININIQPGQLTAIIAESGAGKTTLLNILANYKRIKDKIAATGAVRLYHSQRQPLLSASDIRIALIQQQDSFISTETAREMLRFVAELRAPAYTNVAEAVNNVLKQLELSDCADYCIGDEMKGGLSGGQRRRLSLAKELVAHKLPDVLLCDEITSGLCSNMSFRLIQLLKHLTYRGVTVVVVIHQASAAVMQLFDAAVLLSRTGSCVFNGSKARLANRLHTLGYHNFSDNIADSALLYSQQVSHHDEMSVDSAGEEVKRLAMNSISTQQLQQAQPSASLASQLSCLSQRTFRIIARNPSLLLNHLIITVGVAVALGLIFYPLQLNLAAAQNRAGLLFFLLVYISFSCLSCLHIFMDNYLLVYKELYSRLYSWQSYLLCAVAMDLGVLRLFPIFLLSLVVYFLAGLQAAYDKFLTFLLVLLLAALITSLINYSLSNLIQSASVATFVSVLVAIFSLLFGGFLYSSATEKGAFLWLQSVSYLHYAYEALFVNEFRGLSLEITFTRGTNSFTANNVAGEIVMQNFGVKEDNLFVDIMSLACFSAALFFCLSAAVYSKYSARTYSLQ
jgi:ABC-type multidrug transport system ATPase subunit